MSGDPGGADDDGLLPRGTAVRAAAVMFGAGALGLLAQALATPPGWPRLLLQADAALTAVSTVALLVLPWRRWPTRALVLPLLVSLVIAVAPAVAEPRPQFWLPLLPGYVWAGLVLPRGTSLATAPALAAAVAAPSLILEQRLDLVAIVSAVVITVGASEGLAVVSRRAVEARRRAQRAEAQLSVLLAHAPGIVAVVDRDLRVHDVSSRVQELLGVAPVGSQLRDFVHPEDVLGLTAAVAAAPTGPGDVAVQARLRRHDGMWRRVSVTVSALDRVDSPHWAVLAGVDVTDDHEVREALSARARHDTLTGLPNRLAMQEALDAATASDDPASVVLAFVDLDGFKLVNDSLGHGVGDGLLRRVADRLRRLEAPDRVVARLSGDEFAVLGRAPAAAADGSAAAAQGGVRWGAAAARTFGEQVRAVLAGVEEVDGHEVHVRPSVGVAVSAAGGPDVLLRHADLAMYRAKRNGGGVEVYEEQAGVERQAPAELAAQLPRAVREGELVVHYQPVVRLHDEEVVAVEALVRWCHPEHGMLPPAAFVPVAERAGMGGVLCGVVLDGAIHDLARWQVEGRRLPVVALNVSVVQLEAEGFVERVREGLAEVGLPGSVLCLEVGENGVLLSGPARDAAHRLASLGVRFALDDVGCTASTLDRLRLLPVTALKLDAGLVADVADDPSCRRLVAGVQALAAAVGVEVVAEGVETAEQLVALRAVGCFAGQGFWWWPAMPAEQLTRLLPQLRLHDGSGDAAGFLPVEPAQAVGSRSST